MKEINPDRYIRLTAEPMLGAQITLEAIYDRQAKVKGFDSSVLAQKGGLFVGCGGLAGAQARPIMRKGLGWAFLVDMDVFEPSNYPRQCCYPEALFKNKAIELAKILAHESMGGAEIVGMGLPYQDARHYLDWDRVDFGVCNVDNDDTRVAFSIDFMRMGKPAIFCGVTDDANMGYVYVQSSRPGDPCFGCLFPHTVNDHRHPCPGSPACADILVTLAGFVIYAVDTLFMKRLRTWNYRQVFLDGTIPDAAVMVERNPHCPLCGAGVVLPTVEKRELTLDSI